MTFAERASKSVNNLRILYNLDITQDQDLWVNAGAGVWYVNKDGLYPEVDSSLLTGFTVVQTFPAVGSVLVDNILLAEATTLLYCSDNDGTFYWDGTKLYIHITGGDSPYIHTITIGVVYGYSDIGFTPSGSMVPYDSRLLSIPSISQSRDPLFYGKLVFEGGSASLNNADGGLDTLGEDNDAYGNQSRVLMGFEDLDIADYQRLFTGFVDTLQINERECNISFKDKRNQLTKEITYTCTALNAVSAIQEILLDEYDIPYDSIYYNQTQWEIARAKAYNITINMQTAESAIEVIQKICESTFGLFLIDPDGKYSFKIVRPGDAATFIIPSEDILNEPLATYDPSEVITSTKIGYAKDWTKSEASAYTYLTDTTQEATIYAKYKTYNQRTFDTMLIDATAAQTFSDVILAYSGTIRPKVELEIPITYYNLQVGDFAEITINRPNATWFGERKCEIISKAWNLDRGTISVVARIYGGEIAYRYTTDGYYRVTTDGELRKVGY